MQIGNNGITSVVYYISWDVSWAVALEKIGKGDEGIIIQYFWHQG